MITTRYLKFVFLLALWPSKIMALPEFESGICTHMFGLDQPYQVKRPTAASPNAIEDTRKSYVERFGKPTFENGGPEGITLTWVVKDGSVAVAQNVTIEVARGDLHVTCALAF